MPENLVHNYQQPNISSNIKTTLEQHTKVKDVYHCPGEPTYREPNARSAEMRSATQRQGHLETNSPRYHTRPVSAAENSIVNRPLPVGRSRTSSAFLKSKSANLEESRAVYPKVAKVTTSTAQTPKSTTLYMYPAKPDLTTSEIMQHRRLLNLIKERIAEHNTYVQSPRTENTDSEYNMVTRAHIDALRQCIFDLYERYKQLSTY